MRLKALLLSASLILSVVAGAWLAAGSQPAPETSGRTADAGAFDQRVRAALLAQPGMIVEALRELESSRDRARAGQTTDALMRFKDRIRGSAVLPVGGNPAGDVTVVEFFDYRCGFCRKAVGPMAELVRRDPGVRIVYKEFPVLGADSLRASRLAIAATAQGGYLALHQALMAHDGSFDEEALLELAASQGLDAERLRQDMASPWVESEIAQSHMLASALGINGTPAFVIGDRVVPGLTDHAGLSSLVRDARRNCVTC